MENKLQELTQKLYNEGLSKGKQEAETLLSSAQKEAAEIVAKAKAQAEEIVKKAQTQAEESKKNTLTELSLAGKQSISAIKQQIEKLILTQAIDPAVSAANNDPKFIQELLLSVASNWSASSARVELSAVLPAAKQEQLSGVVEQITAQSLKNGLEISFDSRVESGFKIGPKEGGYYISFSDKEFNALLGEYLRPQVSKLLFEE